MLSVKRLAFTMIALLFSTAAYAHPGHGIGGLLHGFFHPILGLDHLITAVAIGVWAVQIRGRALFAFPTAFVLAMVLGGLVGFEGHSLPFQEAGIFISMLFLGMALLFSIQMSIWTAVPVIALFGVFHGNAHGNAHGSEMISGLSAASYSVGFILSTTLLHIGGITGITLLKKTLSESHAHVVIQAIGAFIVVSAGCMGLSLV